MKKIISTRVALASFTFIIYAACAVVILQYVQTHGNLSESEIVHATATQSGFAFTGARGWTDPDSTDSAISTNLAVFSDDKSCFIIANQHNGNLNATAQLKHKKATAKKIGITMKQIGTKTIHMQTTKGSATYKLHEYSRTSSSHKASALGYVATPNGYATIAVVCKKVSQLPSSIPALQAIKFSY